MRDAESVLATLDLAAARVRVVMDGHLDWGRAQGHAGQYALDVAADSAALDVLADRGFAVLSEESGLTHEERELMVVVDPVDGSTNASLGLPWFASSYCVFDSAGPWVSLVVNLVTGQRFAAVRGRGASVEHSRPVRATAAGRVVLGVNGIGAIDPEVWQVRCLGSAALELCGVACGQLDAWVDLTATGLAPWDYLGAWLVLAESGCRVGERHGRDVLTRDPTARRILAAGRDDLGYQLAVGSWAHSASRSF